MPVLLSEVGCGSGSGTFCLEESRYIETLKAAATGMYLAESRIHLFLRVVILLETYVSSVETQAVILSVFNEMPLHFLVLSGLFLDATLS